MLLEKLVIRRPWRVTQEDEIQYEGEIEYAGSAGKVTINLTDQVSRKILAVVADQLVESSKQVAHNLTAEVIANAGRALTHEAAE